jgi:hypothetical protein
MRPALNDIESGAKVEKRGKKSEWVLARRHPCRRFANKKKTGRFVVV